MHGFDGFRATLQSTIARNPDDANDKNNKTKNQQNTQQSTICNQYKINTAPTTTNASCIQINEEGRQKYPIEQRVTDIKHLLQHMQSSITRKLDDLSFRISFIDIFSEFYKRKSSLIIAEVILIIICTYWDELRQQVPSDIKVMKHLLNIEWCYSWPVSITTKLKDVSFRISFIDTFSGLYKSKSSIIPEAILIIICAYWDELRKQHKQGDKLLRNACENGDIKTVQRVLTEGMINSCDYFYHGWGILSPFWICIKHGYIKIAQLLIDNNNDILAIMHDIDHRTNFGITCLHHAVSNGQLEMCKLLICNGCDKYVNKYDRLGCTPLMYAAEIGSIEIINILIQNKANVNIIDKYHYTALSYCLDCVDKREPKYLHCAMLLIHHGANANYCGKDTQRSILHCVAAFGILKWIKILIENKNVRLDVKDIDGKTPIDFAIQNNKHDVVAYLRQLQQKERTCILM
eukprot:77042_1